MAPVIVNQGEVVLKDMRWGLIPFWAKDEDISNRMTTLAFLNEWAGKKS